MTTLLTLTAMFSAVRYTSMTPFLNVLPSKILHFLSYYSRENTPIVSYVKAIDIWMVYCIFIVFTTLLEFSIFVWLRNYKTSKREKKLQAILSIKNLKDESDIEKKPPSLEEISSRAALAFERTAILFNRSAFAFFVLHFLIFNLVYWPWLFVYSEHHSWEVNKTLNGEPEGTFNGGFLDEL